MRFFVYFALVFQLLICVFGTENIGCRDESGNLIDWFYLYKLPNTYNDQNRVRNVHSGFKYLFVTPSVTSKWVLSKIYVNDSASIPGRTLDVAYQGTNKKENLVMMYNDEPPNGKTDGSRGHTKGVLVGNSLGGFWLIHSVPKYPPPLEESYDFPSTGSLYGQSFLCINMNQEQLAKVGKQLQFNEPHFYSSQVPENLKTIYPDLVEALEMKTIKTAPFYSIATLQSNDGSQFVSFAKSRKFQKELYEDLAAPYFDSGDYYVETWRHGPGNLDSDCTKPSKVYNIEQIEFKTANITFKTLKDHSKWMVEKEKKLICVGDINRQEHQKVRGGGTVCQQTKVSSVYADLVEGVESCKKSRNQV